MPTIVSQRKRILLAVEGEGEQSFIKFLQYLCDKNNIHIHLDCVILNGGGYKTMLLRAVAYRSRKEKSKGKAKESILIVDTDRAEKNEDGWSLQQLQQEAKKENFTVCLQEPNLEGLLLRILPGKAQIKPSLSSIPKLLSREWSDYQKPADSQTLMSKFTFNGLKEASRYDPHLKNLLIVIGLLSN